MKSFIRNLSANAEFFLVTLVGFSWGILGSAQQLIAHLTHSAKPEHLSDGLVLAIVLLQLLALTFAFWIGRLRGWSPATLGWKISWKETGSGVFLFIAAALVMLACIVFINMAAPGLRNHAPAVNGLTVGRLTLPFIIALSIINPIYEEVLGTGYFIHALQRHGKWVAVLASAIFRAFLHSYQGADAVIIVFPLGLVLGLFYWRYRQLWPLIVAHVLFDLWPLLVMTH